ncbi:hypothetical protein [Pseudomonas sp. dw_612]|uniref:hypothetical protein n=1 Tax=Pseudomonas sp. dw_612 TaxID=2720080 RepID=UPI002116F0F9|nr:hypothetical protein [Pseudomonas sp. dw_612]
MFRTANDVLPRLDNAGFFYDVQVLEFRARAALNQPCRGKLELVSERPVLEQLEADAGALGLSCQSELFYYANVMASLDGTSLDQHPHIHRLLHTPSLQSPGERVALAADLAHQWAIQRGRP